MSKSSFFWTKISITFCKQYSRIEFCPDLRNSHSGMWRLLASSLVSTLGNSLRKCGSEVQRGLGNHCLYQAAFEDGSHFSNPSSYLAGLISEYFQGAPRIPYKPVFLDGWSPGYVTFAEENQVIVIFSPNLQLQLHGCNCICVFLYLSISPLPTSPDDCELSLKCIYSP